MFSLKSKILLGVFLFSTFFTLSMAYAINTLHQKYLINQLEQNLLFTANNFIAIQLENIVSYNLVALRQSLYQTVLQNKLQHGRFSYFDGKVIEFNRVKNKVIENNNSEADFFYSKNVKYYTYFFQSEKFIAIKIPVLVGGEVFGGMHLTLSFNSQNGLLEHSRNIMMTIGIVALLLISSLVMWWVIHSITRPIDNLMLVAKKLSENDYSMNIKASSDDEIGELTDAFLTMRDTIKRQFEQSRIELTDRNKQLVKAQSVAQLGFWEWKADNDLMLTTDISRSIMLLPEATPRQLSLDKFCQYMEPKFFARFQRLLLEIKNSPDGKRKELTCVLSKKGHESQHIIIQLQQDASSSADCIGTVRNISKDVQNQKSIHKLAYFDLLTELPNRSHFIGCLNKIISEVSDQKVIAILFLDIDKFKSINDTYGHDVGDEIIKRTGWHIRSALSSSPFTLVEDYLDQDYLLDQMPISLVSRYGGDEYVSLVVAENRRTIDECITQLGQFLGSFEITTSSGIELSTSISIGVSLQLSFKAYSAKQLISQASIALHFSKLKRNSKAVYFTSGMRTQMESVTLSEAFVKETIEQCNLTLLYQPIVASTTLEVVSIEALTRFNQSDKYRDTNVRGFIDDVERLGLMSKMDQWMVRQACMDGQLRACTHSLYLPVSINVSPLEIDTVDFVDGILRMLSKYQMSPSLLRIEVTENESLDRSSLTTRNIQRIREEGIKVYIDDFGTGYTSLASLNRIEIDGIKIDRGLIKMLGKNSMGDRLVETAVSLAHAMDATVVAEGVESQQQVAQLVDMGVEYLQGYMFGRPMSHSALISSLALQKSAAIKTDII